MPLFKCLKGIVCLKANILIMKIAEQRQKKKAIVEVLVKVIKSLRFQQEGYNIKYYKKGEKVRTGISQWNER